MLNITKPNIHLFRDLHYDVTELIEMETTYRDILSGTLEIYVSTISNNLNEVMKKLTVYGSYILVPTLIAGIYGMNFQHMPEIPWIWGYPFALGLMVFTVILMHSGFKRMGWI